MKNSTQVICLGEALVDRLGPIGGGSDFENSCNDYLGGAPANVACGLARLGIKSAFIGCLGNDSIGRKFCDLFNSRGVNISALQINKTLPSRIVMVERDDLGERSFGGFFPFLSGLSLAVWKGFSIKTGELSDILFHLGRNIL